MDRIPNLLSIVVVVVSLIGCRGWQVAAPTSSSAANHQSPLKPVGMAEDSFRLEIITVMFPLGEEELNTAAWSQIDEQSLPPETRRCLADNGFRVGIITGQLPAEVGRLLTATEQPATLAEAAANFARAPVVSRQSMQLHSGWHGELVASRIYDEIPLLMLERTRRQSDVVGRPYRLAQGIFNVVATATGDRRVKLQFTPQLHHGEPRQAFVVESEDGQLRPQPSKPKENFENLVFETTLGPEQMLALTSLPQCSGTLGHYFFTERQTNEMQQKMIIVRLEQARYSDLFSNQPFAGDLPLFR
ncbi:MAG: hypothetical protein IT427_11545 [Pirellulales bacterium]|nr:hypothetical protein [Pirellulales bacterium]